MTEYELVQLAAIEKYLEQYPEKANAITPTEMGIYRVSDGVEIWFEQGTNGDAVLIFASWIAKRIATAAQINSTIKEFRASLKFSKSKSKTDKRVYLEARGMTKH